MPHDLLRQLETWATDRRILPRLFQCRHYESCNQSHGSLQAGASVCMSYVGPKYQHPVEGHDIRLVIIGLDHGAGPDGPYSEDFATRREAILSIPSRGPFNPQYRGVVKTAAAIFGQATRCMECAEQNRCQRASTPDRPCVLEMFAQPNLVKCANGANMTSGSTPTMMSNCVTLLVEELEILRPTVVVTHGVGVRPHLELAVTSRGWKHKPVPGDDTGTLFEILGSGLTAHVCYLAHPSRGHLARQWSTIVEPALAHLRRTGEVPP
jgi:hypothetical protein